MRRLFYRWLSAARDSRHRRLLVQKGEDEMRRAAMARAWNKWRERYQDAKLQPLVSGVLPYIFLEKAANSDYAKG